jgi:hypothetical protein
MSYACCRCVTIVTIQYILGKLLQACFEKLIGRVKPHIGRQGGYLPGAEIPEKRDVVSPASSRMGVIVDGCRIPDALAQITNRLE